nr:GntR family transcriptional regulator [Frankia nepalensis]
MANATGRKGVAVPDLQRVLPKYLQIANHLRDQILRGDLRPGAEVPSERTLAVDWKVSRPTATKALEALRVQGLIESRQGSGSYVVDQMGVHRRARERYGRGRETGAIYPPNEWARIVAAEIVAAPEHVEAALGGDVPRVIRRHRITHGDDGPVEVSTSWISAALADVAPRLLQTERIREGTLAYLASVTGLRARLARDRVTARLATDTEAADLELGPGPHAVLVVRHVVCTEANQPLEFVEAVYPPESWTFEQEYPVTS